MPPQIPQYIPWIQPNHHASFGDINDAALPLIQLLAQLLEACRPSKGYIDCNPDTINLIEFESSSWIPQA